MSRQTDPVSPARAAAVFTVRCGAERAEVQRNESGIELRLPLPVLAGSEVTLVSSGEPEESGGILTVRGAGILTGAVVVPAGPDLRSQVRSAYERILRVSRGLPLWRVWNCVPGINQCVEGLENYRAFNAGRHDAVAAFFGPDFRPFLPAASAVGGEGDHVAVTFLAGEGPCRHFENPRQCPSCDYPAIYGDPPPAFARGTVVERDGQSTHFLSGTASIRGHETAGTTLREQFGIMAENIRLMLDRMETPDGAHAEWRVFLRRASDLAEARALFAEVFSGYPGTVQWVRADICRANLLTEIEAVFTFPSP